MLVKHVCRELDDNYPGNSNCLIKVGDRVYEICGDSEPGPQGSKTVYLVAEPLDGKPVSD